MVLWNTQNRCRDIVIAEVNVDLSVTMVSPLWVMSLSVLALAGCVMCMYGLRLCTVWV